MSRLLNAAIFGVSALALASCASTGDSGNKSAGNGLNEQLGVIPGHNGAAEDELQHMDAISRSAYWGTRYDRNPNDATTAVSYSRALRAMGSNDEALKVMQRFANTVKDTPAVNTELGKVLIANDRAFEAVRPLEKAVRQNDSDWQSWSAYGVALDRIGQHEEARRQYDRALTIAPNKASVLNNKGLSYALSGNLQFAELTLRKASVATDGTAQVRQNLALVLAFAGKTSEAERLARSDLPPRVANNNVAYYQALVAQPAYWQEFTGDNVEMPSFGAETIAPPRAAKMTPVYEAPLPAAAAPTTLQPAATPAPAPQPAPEPEDALPEGEDLEDVLSSLQDGQAEG